MQTRDSLRPSSRKANSRAGISRRTNDFAAPGFRQGLSEAEYIASRLYAAKKERKKLEPKPVTLRKFTWED